MVGKPGRHTKLTPEVQQIIVDSILTGYTLGSAAKLAGIRRSTLFLWLTQGNPRNAPKLFMDFSDSVRAAQKQAAEVKIKANPRPLARARYERDATPDEMRNAFFLEIIRCRKQGRVPYDAALEALQMAIDELEDSMAEESLSWVDDPVAAPVHGGSRGRMSGRE